MNDEQKDFNIKNDVNTTETVSLDTNMESKVSTPSVSNVEMSLNDNTTQFDSSVNAFAYAEPSVASNTEILTEENVSSTEPSVNAFSYTEFPSPTNVEVPTSDNNSVLEPGKNDSNYATPEFSDSSYAEISEVGNRMADSTSNAFSYVEPNEITQEAIPDVSYENTDVSINSSSSVDSNYSQMNFAQSQSIPSKKDTKNNFTFMIIFGIIMLAIIIALPYIAGYK